jgi:hypothetical protein
LSIHDTVVLPDGSYTYISSAHGTTSWLDPIVTTQNGRSNILNTEILYGVSTYDHLPMLVEVRGNVTPVCIPKVASELFTFNWHKASSHDLKLYLNNTDKFLSKIQLPVEALTCTDPNCKNYLHAALIDSFYSDIVTALSQSAEQSIPIRKGAPDYQVPGWNTYVKDFHEVARSAYLAWHNSGKPRQGPVFDEMRFSRAKFKYAFRYGRNLEGVAKADAMAAQLSNNDVKDFWKNVKQISQNKSVIANVVNGCTGEWDIAVMWENHYKQLFNSVNNCKWESHVQDILGNVESDPSMKVSPAQVSHCISTLELDKAAGLDGLSAEALLYSHPRLNTLLSLCFNTCFSHGSIPMRLLDTFIIPVLKNKCGDITDQNNYRPIAITNVLSKVLELLILERCESYLYTTDNQFGFKRKHSVDMCVYILNEVIEYYKQRNTTVFVTYLDATKAFDRVNHWSLFKKLLDRGVPAFLVKILAFWYSHQSMCVKWGDLFSEKFNVSNGVRQGGILSPSFFNVYMDDLSKQLSSTNIGCNMAGRFINHLGYADDMSLLTLTSGGMQKLLDICSQYGVENDVIYHKKKTVCMLFKPKCFKSIRSPSLYLDGSVITYVSNHKYLGIIMSEGNWDVNIKQQMRKFYGRANMLLSKFGKCSTHVKVSLFRAFCTNMYCCHLWTSYTKAAMNKLRVAYNNCFRRLFKLDLACSASGMFVEHGVSSFGEVLRNMINGFIKRLNSSQNQIILAICNSSIIFCSPLWKYWFRQIYVP